MTNWSAANGLAGKVALVVGATSGIGRATALAFGAVGAKTIVSGRRQAEGNATVEAIRGNGGEAIFVAADVQNEDDMSGAVAEAVKTYGRLDIAFNNAGNEGRFTPIDECTVEAFNSIMDVNVRGLFFALKHQVRQMKAQGGGGAIVNCASLAAHIGLPNAAFYVASKHAVVGMTKAVALEAASQGIRVNAVSPGGVDTPLLDRWLGDTDKAAAAVAASPLGRFGEPDEIAGTVLWLCSPAATYITGQAIRIDGGNTTH
ncbi:SDR family NAD(P)-dependent oxidoreductase [Brucella anthropi]|uniref:SDR family NAD(P)-dependent oxidoreductase n=1 Tax=Brucella anthropi TaxID=529 RepID=UPI0021573F32|nr:glucose 1-dehydrogenase [Brucella anthropi]MCR8492666.1 glucose 1-dehydrogenase [Brucella anthropi]